MFMTTYVYDVCEMPLNFYHKHHLFGVYIYTSSNPFLDSARQPKNMCEESQLRYRRQLP